MQKSKLYARTDYKSTIYSICMHQNLLFFMEKLPKMPVSWSKIEYFGLRQAVTEPAPPILRVLDAKKHAVWTYFAFLQRAPSNREGGWFSCLFQAKKNKQFLIKEWLFFADFVEKLQTLGHKNAVNCV